MEDHDGGLAQVVLGDAEGRQRRGAEGAVPHIVNTDDRNIIPSSTNPEYNTGIAGHLRQ
jgi:hypothetical protein